MTTVKEFETMLEGPTYCCVCGFSLADGEVDICQDCENETKDDVLSGLEAIFWPTKL